MKTGLRYVPIISLSLNIFCIGYPESPPSLIALSVESSSRLFSEVEPLGRYLRFLPAIVAAEAPVALGLDAMLAPLPIVLAMESCEPLIIS